MSYDLTFCRRERTPLDPKELIGFFKKYPWFKELPEDGISKFQVCYENQDTGVHFSFDSDAAHTCQDEEMPCTPPGFYPVGLWFNINFIRPTFYAREAMPIVEALCRELDLLVIDPQENFPKDQVPRPKECRVQELIATWEKGNLFGIRAAGRDFAADFYPRGKAYAWWKYMMERARLEPEYGAPYVTLGAVMNARGNKNEAWSAARRALEFQPDYAWSQNLIGVLY